MSNAKSITLADVLSFINSADRDTRRIVNRDIIAPIVDVQPAYNLLAVAKASDDSFYSEECKAFARFKLREAIRQLRETAKFLDKELYG